jgi:hypothetical protein
MGDGISRGRYPDEELAMGSTDVNRRDALRRLAAGGVGAATSSLWVENLCALAQQHAARAESAGAVQQAAVSFTPRVLDAHQLESVATLCDLIIPTTDTPGARAVLVHQFADGVLADASDADRRKFLDGLAWLDARSTALFQKDFVSATPAQQADLLTRLSASPSAETAPGPDFFQAAKSMTIAGYYTTQVGLQQELGDDGVLFMPVFRGCTHPEHQV